MASLPNSLSASVHQQQSVVLNRSRKSKSKISPEEETKKAQALAMKHKPKAKPVPPFCTVPLALVFTITCILIAIVFTVVTVVPTVSFTAQVEANVKSSLSTALEGAMKYVTDPLIRSHAYALQLKEMIELRPATYACDDTVTSYPGNTSTVNFLFEVGMYALQRTDLYNIFQARNSPRFLNSDSTAPAGTVCIVSPGRQLVQLFMNNSHVKDSYTNGSYFDTLSTQPGGTPTFVDATTLALMRGTKSTNTSKWVSDSIAPSVTGLAGPANKYTIVVHVNDPTDPGAVWAVGIDHNLVDLHDTLLKATPPITVGDSTTAPSQVSGAHTTIYDINDNLIMASTHPDVPVATSYGTLYTAGESPSSLVNTAYEQAIAKCGTTGCTTAVVTLDGDTVHTAYRINLPSADLNLLMVSSVPRSFFFADADRTFIVTLSLSIVSCVLIIAGCVALLVAIHRPLNKLKDNMMLAAELHNDEVEYTNTYLTDIADLSTVFDGMNQQLLIARSFVPEAVLLGKSEDSQEEDRDDEGSAVGTIRTVSIQHNSKNKSRHCSGSDVRSSQMGTNNSSDNSSGGIAKLFNVAEKRVGVLSLNLVGFHALCAPDRNASRLNKIGEISTALLTLVLEASHTERGVMDSFHGDHFTLTFNASRAVAGPLAAAIRVANMFIKDVHDNGLLTGAGGVAAGAASGRAHVGTFGIDGYRRLSVVGDAYRSATALQHAAVQYLRMNGSVGIREGCMVDEGALREIGSCGFHAQVIGCLQSSQHRTPVVLDTYIVPQPPVVYFIKTNAIVADEWLYELDAIESSDTMQLPNMAMLALLRGDMKMCSELLEKQATEPMRKRNAAGSMSMCDDEVVAFDDDDIDLSHSRGMMSSSPSASGGVGVVLTDSERFWNLLQSHYNYSKQLKIRLKENDNESVEMLTKQCGLPWVFFQQ